jgi:polyisoprenoid-binding protein YceI
MKRAAAAWATAWSILVAPPVWAATYQVDPEHTRVGFKIRHLFSKVSGIFDRFEGMFDYVPGQPEQWKASAMIQAASINTHLAARDRDLRSPNFFDVEHYPTIIFTSTQVTDVTPSSAKLHGLLTMHGVQKSVILDVQIHGETKDPSGTSRTHFTASTTINRRDFGITWNKVMEAGQLVLGKKVEITIDVEGIEQG